MWPSTQKAQFRRRRAKISPLSVSSSSSISGSNQRRSPGVHSVSFNALGIDVRVRVDDPSLLPDLRGLTASYPHAGSESFSLRFDIESEPPLLWCDEQLAARCASRLDLVPLFEWNLYRQLAQRSARGWLVHAAALASERGAVLLVGPSGCGKSTLSLALTTRGMSYITDDCTLVDDEGLVVGVRRPIGFDAGGLRQPIPTGFTSRSYTVRLPDGSVTHPQQIHPPRTKLCERAPLSVIVTLRHTPDEEPGWRRLSAGEALCALWPQTMRLDQAALDGTIELIARYPAFAVTTRDIEGACVMLENLTGSQIG